MDAHLSFKNLTLLHFEWEEILIKIKVDVMIIINLDTFVQYILLHLVQNDPAHS